jgi:hypothetical protein
LVALKRKLLPVPKQYFPEPKDEYDIKHQATLLVGYPSQPRFLSLMLVASLDDIANQGSDTLIVAFVGTSLHVRIFDAEGKKVIDKAETEFVQNAAILAKLKQTLRSVLSTFFLEPQDQQALMREAAHVTDFPLHGYAVSFMSVATLAEMTNEGHNLVIVALVGAKLHIRIFDASGNKVVDKAENELVAGPRLTSVTNLLQNLKQLTYDEHDERLIQKQKQEIVNTAGFISGRRLPPAYPNEFAELRKTGVATFTVPPPAVDSTVADNPFAPYHNVRVTRVRAWIPGVKTGDGKVLVNLTHKGPELIRALDKSLVPFVHKDVSFPFTYNWENVRWDNKNHEVANVAEVLLSETDLRVKIEGDETEYLEMIGPFAEWEIAVTDVNNKEPVDRSQIETIYLDFHGFGQGKGTH